MIGKTIKTNIKKWFRYVAIISYIFFGMSLSVFLDKTQAFDSGSTNGETLYVEKGCVACHGNNGINPVSPYPIVGGHPKEYISDQLKVLRSGERGGAKTALMKPYADKLTDEEIDSLADYLSIQ